MANATTQTRWLYGHSLMTLPTVVASLLAPSQKALGGLYERFGYQGDIRGGSTTANHRTPFRNTLGGVGADSRIRMSKRDSIGPR